MREGIICHFNYAQYLGYARVRVFADLTRSIIRWSPAIICTIVMSGLYPGGGRQTGMTGELVHTSQSQYAI